MAFVLRVTQTPPLNQITELEQIVIVDQTGPAIQLGVSSGSTCFVGEFLKGPFVPLEVFSQGDIVSVYGGFSTILSQSSTNPAAFVQDGSGIGFEGNAVAQLKNKTFRRLVLGRVDTDMTTTDGGATKAFMQFDVTIGTSDTDSGATARDLLIPAGARFADNGLSTATVVVALSQDISIPKGTTVSGGKITINYTLEQDPTTASFTYTTDSTLITSGATAFFVKGTSAVGTTAAIDTVIDTTVVGAVDASTVIASSGISTINSSNASTDVYAAGTAAAALAAKIISLYSTAIDKTKPGSSVTDDITCIWAARNDASGTVQGAIRGALWTNATSSAQQGRGRTCCVSANPATAATSAAAVTAKTNAAALPALFTGTDADRVSVNFPYTKIFVNELQRNILVSPAGWKASLFATLPEEVESGVANNVMQSIVSLEDAFVANPLGRGDYVNFKAKGLSAVLRDKAVGWWFQSSIMATNPTSYPTRAKDNRRRFADFVQDTLVAIAAPYNKEPGTTERVDALVGEIDGFMAGLLSVENPALQRIEGYLLDATSANTPALTGVGIRTIIVKVRMLGDLDDIVFQTQIGPTVDISQTA